MRKVLGNTAEGFLKKNSVLIVILAILIMAGCFGSAKILYLVAALLACCILRQDVEYGICWSFFLIPNIRIFDETGLTFFVNIFMVLPVIKCMLSMLKKKRIPKLMLAFVAVFLVEFIHVMLMNTWGTLTSEISWMLGFVLCVYVSLDPKYHIKREEVYDALTCGIFFSTILYLVTNTAYRADLIGQIVDGNRFSAFADDPNFFSLYILLCMASWINLRDRNVYRILSFPGLMAVGILTASKMEMILTGFILMHYMLFLLLSEKIGKKTKKYMAAVFILIILIAFGMHNVVGTLFQHFLDRLGGNSATLASMTTGRSTIQENYLQILDQNMLTLFFGAGFNYHLFLGEATGHGAHNTYLDFVLAWGITGTLLFMGSMIGWIRAYLRRCSIKKITYYNIFPAMIVMIICMALSCLSASMFPFILFMMIMQLDNSKE